MDKGNKDNDKKNQQAKKILFLFIFFIGLPVIIGGIHFSHAKIIESIADGTVIQDFNFDELVNEITDINREIYYKKQGRYSTYVVEFNYYSVTMQDYITMNVYLPPGYILNQRMKRYPIVYYLHGAFDGEKEHWFTVDRREGKSAHAELSATRMIMNNEIKEIVMVALDEPGGFFTSGSDGRNFEYAFVNEIMPVIEATFSTSGERAITGLSSGGYYAFYFALKYPNLFAYAGATSGSFFLSYADKSILNFMKKNLENLKKLKGVYFDMGNDDPGNINDNLIIYNYLLKHNIRCRFEFVEGGHSFQVWRGHPERLLKVFFSIQPRVIPESRIIH